MASESDTFITTFDRARLANPQKECYVCYDWKMTRKSITFQEAWTLAARFAYILKEHGLQRGNAVIVGIPYSLEYVVAGFGVFLAGGVNISMEQFLSECEAIRKAVLQTQAKILLTVNHPESQLWSFFKPNADTPGPCQISVAYSNDAFSSLRTIMFANKGENDSDPEGFLHYLRGCVKEFVDVGITPRDDAISAVSTSNSWGTGKLCILSHEALVNIAKNWTKQMESFGTIHNRWAYYIVAGFPSDAMMGSTRVIHDMYTPPTVGFAEFNMAIHKAEGLQGAILVPTEVRQVADYIGTPEKKIAKHVLCGGQPTTEAIIKQAQSLSDYVHIMYGMSECCLVSMNVVGPDDTYVQYDAGFPVDGMEVRIVDQDYKDVPTGTRGRIALRSKCLFTRYAGQPDLTKALKQDDGWFVSLDEGYLGANGHLFVFGRSGDIINRGIVLIPPNWLERHISVLDDVRDVTVVPVPDEVILQSTCACVVRLQGSKITEEDVKAAVRKSLSDAGNDLFVLDYVLFFDDGLPEMSRLKLGELAASKLGITKSVP